MNKFLLIFVISLAAVLFVQALEQSVQVQVSVTVLPAYNLSIHLNILNTLVSQGDKLVFVVDLKKKDLTNMSGKIYVDLNYEILRGNTVVKSGFLKKISLTKCYREIFSLKIPNEYMGAYTLRIIASNPQSYTASDEDKFIVKRKWK